MNCVFIQYLWYGAASPALGFGLKTLNLMLGHADLFSSVVNIINGEVERRKRPNNFCFGIFNLFFSSAYL